MNRGRLEEKVTCPYCGHKDWYSFYFESETLYCYNCDKKFAIKLRHVIEVDSGKIFNKRCCACHVPLYDEEIINGECPNCKNKEFYDNKQNDSELDIPNRASFWKNL